MVPSSIRSFDARKHLCRGDVLVGQDGILVTFGWSKTNQFGKRTVLIPIPSIDNSILCPVLAYKKLIDLVPARTTHRAFTFAVKPKL